MPKTLPPSRPAPRRTGVGGLLTLVRLLVFGQFRLRRRGRGLQGVHVVFGETVLAPRDEPADTSASGPGVSGVTLSPPELAVHQDLSAVVQALGDRRHALRYLGFLEQHIGRGGLAGLSALPVEVLARCFDQVALVAAEHDGKGLVELRARLSRLLLDKGHQDHLLADEHATPSDFLRHAQPVVTEGRISEFLTAADADAGERG